MSTANPTALRLGASGMLDGRKYTVRGRVVLSVEVAGEIFYWNEFNLVDASGGEVTLVHEEGEDGAEWKLFKLIEPARPMSVGEAKAISVGDIITLTGRSTEVSLVNQSRVELVEGQAPEGVQVGKVADYFNAEIGEQMLVVSWSGDEIEFYEGSVTSARRIEGAFGLPHDDHASRSSFSTAYSSGDADTPWAKMIPVILVALAVIGYVVYQSFDDGPDFSAPAAAEKRLASPLHFPVGALGKLHGHAYRIRGHALVEISRVGDRFDGHEYTLSSGDGTDRALLVKALQGNSTDWYLLRPGVTPAGFTPFVAAGLQPAQTASIGGRTMHVEQLFRAVVFSREGEDLDRMWPTGAQYGLLARDGTSWMLSRWSETGLQFCTCEIATDREVHEAFGSEIK